MSSSTREDLIKAGLIKPMVKANPAALQARRRDVKTQADKAIAILMAASRRKAVQHA